MESLPDLMEAAVRPLARPQSFERRENYEEKGAVVEVVRRGNTLQAAVEGSQYEPYQTRIELATTGIVDTACSCPYDHGGICKHRVAVLLTVIRDPETVTDRPPVSDLLAEARAFIDAGDGESALTVLEAIATQLMNGEWLRLSLDDSTAIFEFFDEFSAAFSEALLTADLSETDREEWADQIAEWADELASYTRHPPFKTAVVTARRGWDDDALQQVLAGADDADLWEGERPWYADDLLEARLAVLERVGRTHEDLNLARATCQSVPFATELVDMDRVDEAVEYARDHLSTPDDALAVANALRDADRWSAAIEVGRHSLTLNGTRNAV